MRRWIAVQEKVKAGIFLCSQVPIIGCASRNAQCLLIVLSFGISFNHVTILAVILHWNELKWLRRGHQEEDESFVLLHL